MEDSVAKKVRTSPRANAGPSQVESEFISDDDYENEELEADQVEGEEHMPACRGTTKMVLHSEAYVKFKELITFDGLSFIELYQPNPLSPPVILDDLDIRANMLAELI